MGIAILVLGMFALLFTVLIGRPRRRNGNPLRARRPRYLSRYTLDEDRHPMAVVVLAGLAASTVSELVEDSTTGLVLATILAVLCAVTPRATWAFDLIGAAGSVALLGVLVAAPVCSGGSRLVFLGGVVTLALLLGGAVLLGRLASGSRAFPALLIFGLLDVLRFVSAPLGVDWTDGATIGSWAVSVGVVLAMGVLVGFAPRLVLPLLAIGITAVELWAATTYPQTACEVFPTDRGAALVVFLAAYLGVRKLRQVFAG